MTASPEHPAHGFSGVGVRDVSSPLRSMAGDWAPLGSSGLTIKNNSIVLRCGLAQENILDSCNVSSR